MFRVIRVHALLWFIALFCLGYAAGQTAHKPTRDLFDYIQHASKLGLTEDQILKNALEAGWAPVDVDRAYGTAGVHRTGKITSASEGIDDYRIGAGDLLQVVVWKEPEASVPEAVVRADGKITLPLIKEVDVAGLSPAELEKLLTTKFARLITEPDVTVVAKQINSRKVYMIGAVKKEGPLMLRGPTTILQALNEAGGLTEYAKRKKIYVLRTEHGQQTKIPFDYAAAIKGDRMDQNIRLMSGDSVVVPQ